MFTKKCISTVAECSTIMYKGSAQFYFSQCIKCIVVYIKIATANINIIEYTVFNIIFRYFGSFVSYYNSYSHVLSRFEKNKSRTLIINNKLMFNSITCFNCI